MKCQNPVEIAKIDMDQFLRVRVFTLCEQYLGSIKTAHLRMLIHVFTVLICTKSRLFFIS